MDPNNQNAYAPQPGTNQPPAQPQYPLKPHVDGPQKIIVIGMGVLMVVALVFVAYKFGTRHKNSSGTAPLTIFNVDQAKSRDVERETDIKALHGQIEAYYAQNGFYPSLTNMNDAKFRDANLKGLDLEALKDPQGSDYTLVSSPTKGAYAYDVLPSNCDNTKNQCTAAAPT
jgi:Type II secretion system (T2SS), protein G